jgi:hypothetical protein
MRSTLAKYKCDVKSRLRAQVGQRAIVALACDLTAWTQTLALTGHGGHGTARRW